MWCCPESWHRRQGLLPMLTWNGSTWNLQSGSKAGSGYAARESNEADAMNLYTRCLHCGTTFRVTTQQLQASSGQVRCGQCKQVFDAFATLTAQKPQPATPQRETPPPAQSGLPPAASPVERSAPAQIPVRPKAAAGSLPDPAASLYEWEFRMPEVP